MSKKKILCYVLLTAMLVSMFAAGEVSVAAEQQKPAYSNLADAKSRKEVRSALLSAGISAKTADDWLKDVVSYNKTIKKQTKESNMKYVVLVSHGTFAPGLKSVLAMLAGGEREDVISVGLEDGMSADTFAEKFQEAISGINAEDEIILLGDIIGGSPMTNALEQISKKGLEEQTVVFGGMNLAMALTATLMKDDVDTELLKDSLISEAKNAIKEFVLESGADDEEDEI